MLRTIEWTGHAVRLIDQTRLPESLVCVDITTDVQMCDAIRRLVVRGAPAIGVAAAFGVYLGIRQPKPADLLSLYSRLNESADLLAGARPTAVNLFKALDRVRRAARDAGRDTAGMAPADAVEMITQRVLAECLMMMDEDRRSCQAIGQHGLALLAPLIDRAAAANRPLRILTHCNAGALATTGSGTALAPIYAGAQQGVRFEIWADETRPLLQGSRLTAFELAAAGIPVTVICDSMAASLMAAGRVDAVIVGADRVAANGDVANKTGTLNLAIVAGHFHVPFYVAAPVTTIDLKTPAGSDIPIEMRDGREITHGFGRQTAPENAATWNPAFDVTPADLVNAIITDKGVVRPPFAEHLRKVADSPSV